MTPDDNQQTKKDLLRELESLREQLADPNNSDFNDDDIPILLDKVEQAVATAPDADSSEPLDDETAALQAAYDEVTQGLPKRERAAVSSGSHQQSLFTDKAQEQPEDSAPAALPVARGENPFLPKHIRDRLHERRQLLADDIAQASSFFPHKPKATSPSIPAEHQKLIDELVADYLPRIERELRRRLQQLLEESAKEQNR